MFQVKIFLFFFFLKVTTRGWRSIRYIKVKMKIKLK